MKNRIIWAVDPFEDSVKPDLRAIHELQRWAKSANAMIVPVYVLNVSRPDLEPQDETEWLSKTVGHAEMSTMHYVHDLGVSDAARPRILLNRSSSVRRAGDLVVELSNQMNSKVIVVTSRGKAGLGRVLFGSFAETLVLHSKLPTFFLSHPQANHAEEQGEQNLNRILFSTDFSESNKKAFEDFVAQFSGFGAEITLFHNLTLPIQATANLGMIAGVGYIPDNFMKDQRTWAEAEGKRWVEKAKVSGVRVQLLVKEDSPNIADSILKAAHQGHVGMIAMASKSGPVSSALLGSVAREVFRSNEYPVWVYGAQ